MDELFNFCEINGALYIGDNSTNYANGIAPGKTLPNKIIIPYSHNNKIVEYIGQRAFLNCKEIYEVEIRARIKEIHNAAFMGCINLKYINIPSTCTFLGNSSFDGRIYDESQRGDGPVVFYIEKFSALSYLGHTCFSNYKVAIIYIFNNLENSTCVDPNFFGYEQLTLYSPLSFSLCGQQTTVINLFNKTCNKELFLKMPFFAIFLYYCKN